MDPDPTLDFEKGETIYENAKVTEWVRLWKVVVGSTLLTWPCFMIFEIYSADGAPSLDWMSDTWNWHAIPKQF